MVGGVQRMERGAPAERLADGSQEVRVRELVAREERVAVLGYALWAAHFGRDFHVIGKIIHIDDETYTIVGVMPARFRTPGLAEVWMPWKMSTDERRDRRFHLVSTVAR